MVLETMVPFKQKNRYGAKKHWLLIGTGKQAAIRKNRQKELFFHYRSHVGIQY